MLLKFETFPCWKMIFRVFSFEVYKNMNSSQKLFHFFTRTLITPLCRTIFVTIITQFTIKHYFYNEKSKDNLCIKKTMCFTNTCESFALHFNMTIPFFVNNWPTIIKKATLSVVWTLRNSTTITIFWLQYSTHSDDNFELLWI